MNHRTGTHTLCDDLVPAGGDRPHEPPALCAAALHAGVWAALRAGQRWLLSLRLRALLMVVVMVIPGGVTGTRPAAQASLCSAFCSGAISAMLLLLNMMGRH